MPGVPVPPHLQLASRLATTEQRLRALETQQQLAFTNPQGQVVLTLGLVPGSDPADYGLSFFDPNTATQLAFMGEHNGATTLSILLSTGGSIEIDNGGTLLLRAANGNAVLYVGTTSIPDGSGRTQQVVELFRDDASAAITIGDFGTVLNHTHQQSVTWWDRSGNAVFSDDTNSGSGVARPHVPLPPLLDTNVSNWPATTAASWTTIAACTFEFQQPQLSWIFNVGAGAGTTAQFRLMVNGTQVGTTQTVVGGVSGSVTSWSDIRTLAGLSFAGKYGVTLDAQVTAGTGNAFAQQVMLQGEGS